jgi:two-component system response regulator RstA
MIVDDDPVVLEITRERLEGAGFEVTVRDSSLGTSAAILREKPEVVLLDVHMPGIDGVALTQLVRTRSAESPVKILLYSSDPRPRLEELARGCGASGVIEKTSDDAWFFAQLEACMRSSVPPQSARRRLPRDP